MLEKKITNEAILAGGPKAKVFPKIGLGQRIPKMYKAMTPDEHEHMLKTLKEVKVIKGFAAAQTLEGSNAQHGENVAYQACKKKCRK